MSLSEKGSDRRGAPAGGSTRSLDAARSARSLNVPVRLATLALVFVLKHRVALGED